MDIKALKEKYSLETAKQKKEELEQLMSTGFGKGIDMAQVSVDLNHYTTLFNKISSLYKALDTYSQSTEILNGSDSELKELAQIDLDNSEKEIETLENEILDLEIERQFADPDDNRNIIIEIRAGAGGEEASLFASELFRMYKLFGDSKGWETEIIDSNVTENGGYKEVIASIKGKNAFKMLKYEMGVHRVQRIPVTESSGRIHTSTASVAILPEAQDVDIQIDPKDLRIEVMRAGGAGGQCVNRTDSAVRITHIPSGIVVSCQETKHQDQNKVKAMNILKARLYDREKAIKDKERSDLRSSQIGMAQRAEKIRTYNFPQSRVTDHRIKKSWFNIEGIMNGNIDEMIQTVREYIQKGKVEIGGEDDE